MAGPGSVRAQRSPLVLGGGGDEGAALYQGVSLEAQKKCLNGGTVFSVWWRS